MLLLSELDQNWHPVLAYGAPKALSTADEQYDHEPGQALAYLKAQMQARTAAKSDIRLGIIHVDVSYRVTETNRTGPHQPC
jgi:hypothetical protein